MKKILVIGCPGSGKSIFSRSLHQKINLPVVYLDMLNWNKDGTSVSKKVFRERLSAAVSEDAWIIDGNYNGSMEYRLQYADTVFFLDYPLEICLEGVYARRGKARPDMPWIEPTDKIDADFLEFIKHYPEESRPKILALQQAYPDKEWHIFTSREQAEAFLASLISPLQIRCADRGEAEKINLLRSMVHDIHVDGRPDLFRPDFLGELSEHIYRDLDSADVDVIVATIDGVICGFMLVEYIHKPPSPYSFSQNYCHIKEFGVASAYRRRGIASALIEFCKKEATAKGFSRITLDMWEFNQSALAFYKAIGFSTYRRYMEMPV